MREVVVPIKRSIYKKELHKTFLALEVDGVYQEDYQMKMLAHNQIKELVEVQGRGADDVSIYEYDVSGKKTLESVYKNQKIKTKDIKKFLIQFCDMLETIKIHLLDERCLLLSEQHIFYEKERFYFCYFPPGDKHIQEAFHMLTEFFVKQTDYEDTESVQIAFTLHKETMEENYSLKKILEQLEKDKKEEEPKIVLQEELFLPEKRNYEENILKEEHDFWLPVKEFLNKHKKPKWGDWRDLYIEEEKF